MNIFGFLPNFVLLGLVVGLIFGAISAKLGFESLSSFAFVVGLIGTGFGWHALKARYLASPAERASKDFSAAVKSEESGDYAAAAQLYRRLAQQGVPAAMFNLGCLYQKGLGVAQDFGEALKCYRAAADHGHAPSQNNIGLMYFEGQGVAQDLAEARRWYQRAAEQGDAVSQCNLATMYEHGQSVPADDVEALKWYQLAASRGYGRAIECCERLTARMPAGDVSRVEAWASGWKPK
jgi:hypothetical protein